MKRVQEPLDKSEVISFDPILNFLVLFVRNCAECWGYKTELGTFFKAFNRKDISVNGH